MRPVCGISRSRQHGDVAASSQMELQLRVRSRAAHAGYWACAASAIARRHSRPTVRLSLAKRRRLRQGPKGALSDAEIGFVNGAIVADHLWARPVTTWEFVDLYCAEVLAAISARQRGGPALAAATEDGGRTRGDLRSHIPMWFADGARKRRRVGGVSEPAPMRGRGCCLHPGCDAGEPIRPSFYCHACAQTEGCNGWYHWSCYWARHRAVPSSQL